MLPASEAKTEGDGDVIVGLPIVDGGLIRFSFCRLERKIIVRGGKLIQKVSNNINSTEERREK